MASDGLRRRFRWPPMASQVAATFKSEPVWALSGVVRGEEASYWGLAIKGCAANARLKTGLRTRLLSKTQVRSPMTSHDLP